MIKFIKILSRSLAVSSLGLLCWLDATPAWSDSNESEIVQVNKTTITGIYDNRDNRSRGIWKRVQYHTGNLEDGDNWVDLPVGDYLLPQNWLATGEDAEAEYVAQFWYLEKRERELIYRQQEDSKAQFITDKECGFQLEFGRNLIGKRNHNPDECLIVAGTTEVQAPPGFNSSAFNKNVEEAEEENSALALFIFRNDAKETIVGVLASQLGPVKVINEKASQEYIQLKPGEYAFVSDDGRIIKGEFSLEHFYENNPLAFGLGRDSSYVDSLSGGKKRLFERIRKATLEALEKQDKAGPFELKTSNSPSIPGFKTIIDIDSFPGEAPEDNAEDNVPEDILF